MPHRILERISQRSARTCQSLTHRLGFDLADGGRLGWGQAFVTDEKQNFSVLHR